eukprot:TRINITY_DN2073_c1_g1_i1.p1 TRINITY_DN2073_c1_g1~~TRINITY_DN2073_c1_g1_i1.p1  ORF type:complete len:680 (+),score=98.90 TRINITY_DN2073_c1_g1_i1:765-2804(+)
MTNTRVLIRSFNLLEEDAHIVTRPSRSGTIDTLRKFPGLAPRSKRLFGLAIGYETPENFTRTSNFLVTCFSLLSSVSPASFSEAIENPSKADSVDQLKHSIEEGKLEVLNEKTPKPIVVALMARFFDELPEPIIPPHLSSYLVSVLGCEGHYRNSVFWLLLHQLPSQSFSILRQIITFLQKLKTEIWGEIFERGLIGNRVGPERCSLMKSLVTDWETFENWVESGIKYEISDRNMVVVQASLDKLFERFSDRIYHYIEPEFAEAFLLTHSYFISTNDLVTRLFNLLETPSNNNNNSQQHTARKMRILNELNKWAQLYPEELQSSPTTADALLDRVRKVLSSGLISDEEETALVLLQNLLLELLNRNRTSSGSNQTDSNQELASLQKAAASLSPREAIVSPEFPSQAGLTTLSVPYSYNSLPRISGRSTPVLHSIPSFFDILSINPRLIAEQLSVIDHDLLQRIKIGEVLNKNYMEPEKCPSFMEMVSRFNHWSMFVPTEILKQSSSIARAELISHFIKIARESREVRNFNATYAIVGGLANTAITRLRNTWERVSKRSMGRLDELLGLFDMSFNFKNYREALHRSQPPIVPYIGIISKDLASVEDSLESYVTTPDSGNLINFAKMRRLYKLLFHILQSRRSQYSYQLNEVGIFLRDAKVMSEQEVYMASYSLEKSRNTT